MPDRFNEFMMYPTLEELYQNYCGRDFGYLLNGHDHNRLLKEGTFMDNPWTFTTKPNCVIQPASFSWEPRQAGSGDPSPENIRSISGLDTLTITQAGDNVPENNISITLPETIYGGTVDAMTGEGKSLYIYKELAIADMDNNEEYPGWHQQSWLESTAEYEDNTDKNYTNDLNSFWRYFKCNSLSESTKPTIYFTASEIGYTQSELKEQFPDLKIQFCCKLAEPEAFTVTPLSPIELYRGINTVYTNADSWSFGLFERRYFSE